ncbi:MAG: sulfotransferase family 2 domain-containing protein [Halioglobus sp.]
MLRLRQLAVRIFSPSVRIKAKRLLFERLMRKKPLHFLHIGKTGGTAVANAFNKSFYSRDYWFMFHDHNMTLRDIPVGEAVVFFLRDPVSRYVSGFNSRLRCGKPHTFKPWHPKERTVFDEFGTANSLASAITSQDQSERKRARKAMQSVGHVKRSLWFWFESEEYLEERQNDIFFIGFQESLTNDFDMLLEALALSGLYTLTSNPVVSHRSPEDADRQLDPGSEKNIREWFSQDYECIRWCENWRSHALSRAVCANLEALQ